MERNNRAEFPVHLCSMHLNPMGVNGWCPRVIEKWRDAEISAVKSQPTKDFRRAGPNVPSPRKPCKTSPFRYPWDTTR